MSRRNRCPRSPFSSLAKVVIWLAAATLTVASPLFGYYFYLMEEWQSYEAPLSEPNSSDIYFVVSGIRTPPIKSADEAELDDQAEIIGVRIGDHARAYAVEHMGFPPRRHVVNDVLEGQAVSVTYCDRRSCCRVFTEEGVAKPLDLDVGGWKEQKGMMLHVKGVHYAQETGENLTSDEDTPFPYPELPYVRTTWGAWRKAHPNTDVYLGAPESDSDAAGETGE